MVATKELPTKLDLTKLRPAFFKAKQEPAIVELEPARYLTLDGRGLPEQDGAAVTEFQTAIGALYAVVYPLKFRYKQMGRDFKVSNPEAIWWAYHDYGDQPRDLLLLEREGWRWKLLIMVPDYVTDQDVRAVKAEQLAKKGLAAIEHVELEVIEEGLCVQAMHAGPYADEPRTINAMRELIERAGLRACGLHHEVYFGDPNRTAPEKLRTILRQPVRRIEDDEAPSPPEQW